MMVTVALIDDDPSMLKSLGRLLRIHGFVVQCFDSAEIYLDERHARPAENCLVVDVNLTGMSGIQLAEVLAREACSCPIVFMTASDEPGLKDRCLAKGAVAFLRKPFAAQVLLDAVTCASCAQRNTH
jgi:FixJ family two-component response regulator